MALLKDIQNIQGGSNVSGGCSLRACVCVCVVKKVSLGGTLFSCCPFSVEEEPIRAPFDVTGHTRCLLVRRSACMRVSPTVVFWHAPEADVCRLCPGSACYDDVPCK